MTVPKSKSDSTPQTTSYKYTPTGLVATESKPNGNKVSYSYFLVGNEQSQTENKSDGSLVASPTYTYDADGNTASDAERPTAATLKQPGRRRRLLTTVPFRWMRR